MYKRIAGRRPAVRKKGKMNMKSETPEALAKRKEKEAKELARLEKAAAKPAGRSYFLVLLIALTVIYIVDELASSMNSAIQPYMILDLFKIQNHDVNDPAYGEAVGKMAIVTIPGYLFMLVTPFYKSLADKLGRRLFLILNTLIMGLGLFVMMIAPHWIIYSLGVLMVLFVQSNDMQVMYIMETAPAEHRAKLCSLTKGLALASCSLIGVARSLFYSDAVPSSWRYVILIPAILGVAVSLLAIPFVKETPVFLKQRIAFLKTGEEERTAKKLADAEAAKSAEEEKIGVFPAIKYIFRHKQLRNIVFACIVFCVATGVTNYYTTIMESAKSLGSFTKEDLDIFAIVFPLANAVTTVACGFVSDALGRKKCCLALNAAAALGLAGFVFGSRLGWSGLLVGLFYGFFIGTLWSVSDTLVIVMPAESAPTKLRASIVGSVSLLVAFGSLLSIILFVGAQTIWGAESLGIISMFICLPFLIISTVMIWLGVRETAGSDLASL